MGIFNKKETKQSIIKINVEQITTANNKIDISPKYALGQDVFYIYNNKLKQGSICWIDFSATNRVRCGLEIKLTYTVSGADKWLKMQEPELFATKEELLNNLICNNI